MMQAGRGMDPADILGTAENAAHHAQGRHPGVGSALAWLAFSHLPEELKVTARPFYDAALALIHDITVDSAELTTALNKLVESKDWAVRASVRRSTGRPGPMARPQTIVDPPVPSPLSRPIRDNPQA